MNYWLLKSDPDTYSWEDLVKDGKTRWDGIRNYAARLHLRAMQKGDEVFIYHSQTDKAVVGTAKVISEPYPDPADNEWTVVDLEAVATLSSPVTLDVIKASSILRNMPLVRQGRLSAMPITKAQADEIRRLGK